MVREGLDARRQPHEDAPHAGIRGAARLVGRVEHDRRSRLGRGAELLVRLVVAVEEEPLAGDAGGAGEGELAEGRDVGPEALVREHLQERDVRECLRPVDQEGIRRGFSIGPRLRADRLLAVDEQGRPVHGREPRSRDAAELELAVGDACGVGEDREHRLLVSKSR